MKFSTTIILALASTLITASPLPISKRSPDSVLATINQWLNDISRVNAFLNTLALNDPNAAADGASALQFANDEPVQLSALAAVLSPTDTVGQNAVATLMQVFPMVPAAFTVIAESGGDQSVVEAQVGIINSVRCATVLPQIGVLFNAAAADNGLGPQDTPTGPLVCPNPPTLA
ncbi:hypothetical protein L207DRAFT_640176 [Hyaloscypha variabilis F]|uniref:Uncharacterized protein n=1 Tax=Hyaloscypha variabilis (strain UAMH 11265 / GT02V1 / F) TaxID=1149755 RepID=A0A2J6R1I7_HYAVF|nr:hypothetical protein L207DRAFT_640176 [Hyaloscypha variabilis F]